MTAAQRGTRPQPTQLRVIRGTLKKQGRPKFEQARPQPAKFDPPSYLNADAVAEWERVSPMLYRVGLLTEADLPALAAYCQAYSHWVRAEKAFKKVSERRKNTDYGYVAFTSNGTPCRSPLYNAARDAMHDMLRAAVELGMTPSARTRAAAATPPADEADAAQQYFA